MDLFQVIILALIQGVTEFLPVSSSAHLILPSQLLGWSDQGLTFDVAVHFGTLLAVVTYFRRDILALARGWVHSASGYRQSPDGRMAWALLLATVPAATAGFIFEDYIEANLRSIAVIGATTAIFGILLQYADWSGHKRGTLAETTWGGFLLIGLAQALALVPGTSRSGITITAGLLLGLRREEAARFSFLLAIPLIAGAGMFKTLELVATGTTSELGAALLGAGVAALSAFACIHLFLRFVNQVGMLPFTVYRLLLAAVLLSWAAAQG